jgi:aspartate/methionine/tyrosine aminotransferase
VHTRAARWSGFGTSIFTEMTELARSLDAVNLAQGFPDFHGPAELLRAVESHARTSHHQYAPSFGEEALRRAVGRRVDADPRTEVTITSGATEALYSAINALVDPGDRVVVFEPMYDSYAQCIANAGGVLVPVRLHAPDWRIDWDELEAARAGGFRVLLLNTPHNPTGKVFTADELARIAAIVRDADAVAVTDEVYEHMVYDGAEHVSLATLDRDRTVRISSAAKTFGFTGFKVGWVTAPPALTASVRLVHQAVVFATPPFLQTAIAEVMDDDAWLTAYFAELRTAYQARRDLLRAALLAAGFDVPQVRGTYFLMAGFARLAPDRTDVAFARDLIETRKVAAIPPSAFYARPVALPWLRFAFCKRDETLRRAAELLTVPSDGASRSRD